MPLPTRGIIINEETFQMRYCIKFYLNGHQNFIPEVIIVEVEQVHQIGEVVQDGHGAI